MPVFERFRDRGTFVQRIECDNCFSCREDQIMAHATFENMAIYKAQQADLRRRYETAQANKLASPSVAYMRVLEEARMYAHEGKIQCARCGEEKPPEEYVKEVRRRTRASSYEFSRWCSSCRVVWRAVSSA